MPPPSVHASVGTAARYYNTHRAAATADDRPGFALPTAASAAASTPRFRYHRDTSEPPRHTPSATASSTRLPTSTSGRRVSFSLSETSRPAMAPAASSLSQQSQSIHRPPLSQQQPQKRTLTKRRSALVPSVPHIDTRVPPTSVSRARPISPIRPPPERPSARRPSSPPASATQASIRIYPELDRWPRHGRQASTTSSTDGQLSLLPLRLATDLQPPSTPSILSGSSSQLTASPSTHFSESPSPWPWSATASAASIPVFGGPSSRDVTPISAPSQSPAPGLDFAGRHTGGRGANKAASPGGGVSTPINGSTTPVTRGPPVSPPPRKSSWTSPRQRNPTTSPILTTAKSTPKSRRLSDATQPQRPIPSSAKPVIVSANPRADRPRRPSRDGMPNILGLHQEPPPIIQSNLTSAHASRGGPCKPVGALLSSPDRSRRAPAASENVARAPIYGPSVHREPTPALEPPPRQLRTPSPVISNGSSRFAFFGKKKTATAEPAPAREKPARRGPAAGTGHEGYGRFGAARRRSGSFTSVLRGLSSSQESLPTDSFFLDRMSPVVISGGAVVKNHNEGSVLSQTSSINSLTAEPGGVAPSAGASKSSGLPQRTRRPSDSSDSEAAAGSFTLSRRKFRMDQKKSPMLKTPNASSPFLDTSVGSSSYETMSDDPSSALSIPPAISPGPRKLVKRSRSPRRWNLFSSKAHYNAEKDKEKGSSALPDSSSLLPAAVGSVPTRRMAYYMLDASSPEQPSPSEPDIDNVRNALRGADVQLPGSAAPTPYDTERQAVVVERLSPSGFIPPVSFSRPFNPTSFHAAMLSKRAPAEAASASTAESGSVPASTLDLVADSATSATTITASSPDSLPLRRGRASIIIEPGPDFIRFSVRQDSTASTATTFSSSGTSSSALFLPGYANTVAVQPTPGSPLVEDEIWDEYNDLVGFASPTSARPLASAISVSIPMHPYDYDNDDQIRVPQSTTSSRGSLFPLEAYNLSLSQPTAAAAARLTQTSSIGSADMTERLGAIFAPKPELASITAPTPAPTRPIPALPAGASSTAATAPRARSSTTGSARSRVSSTSSTSDSPLEQVNLRIGSMTVSKWLTFGHVMFSPVREQLVGETLPTSSVTSAQTSVLVLDGLGNDDWSFYAAETYPGATFFNLSPRAPVSASRRASSGFPLSPPNHHQIQHTSLAHKLPFGAETFAAVVLRFPAAGPEAHLRNAVAEARRVLVPGGYIELAVLDMDLNNMGNRARRAVRQRKEALCARDPKTALGSVADTLLRLLGARGFGEIKSCRVGLPVAPPARTPAGADRPSAGTATARPRRDTRSLAEMMSDESAAADESITRVVSRVGRWWYARCYEGLRAGSGASMWHDAGLLAECADWGTSFKLMVCHARVPLDAVSRVASI
ncbi:uncharacterized protein BROUX77_004049 [Berkeleyomyces rouxiae]|uniref:uncharacterized protein n=1 Tax=Berkeleyomyces rouxiae TaxID=2035830 RepID=UPI003B7A2507